MRPGMKPSCARMFEAEAMRDGRLGGAELASFGRHITGCPVCLREVRALEALAEALRAGPRAGKHDGGGDELRVQRERTRLLAAFDGALVTPRPRWLAGRRLLAPAAVAVIVTGLLVFWRTPPARQQVDPSSVVVRGDRTAVWTRRHEGGRQQVTLERGALWIQVDHPPGQPLQDRLVVLLPDGELEDAGTTFTVSAENGHTTRVAVQEGRVMLRIRGRPPVAIGPGEAWFPEEEPRPAPAAPAAPVTPAAPLVPPARTAARPPSSAAARPDPAGDFRAAMAMLDAGENLAAAGAFTRFLARHPHDRRAEDAAYLRVIALQRSGASDDMARAAQDYLQRYPTGFRRTEVKRLSRVAGQPGR
jgi:TolA-binding protein